MAVPKGTRIGGRKKGTRNKASAAREKQIAESGLTPLDFMLGKLRGKDSTDEDRKWAAEKAAPFVHPRLNAVDFSGSLDITHEKALDELE